MQVVEVGSEPAEEAASVKQLRERLRTNQAGTLQRASSEGAIAATSRSSSRKKPIVFSEERPVNLRLNTVLGQWSKSVQDWCKKEGVHPGRLVRTLNAEDRKMLQFEADDKWCAEAHTVAVRGVQFKRSLMARSSQEQCMLLLEGREGPIRLVVLLGFTYDRPDVTGKLIELARGGTAVIVVVDKKSALSGMTKEMPGALMQMAAQGVVVRVAEGDDSRAEYEAVGRCSMGAKGVHHCKGIFVHLGLEAHTIIGSCNWTTSSRSGRELGVYLTLRGEGVEYYLEIFGLSVVMSEDYSEAARQAHLRRASSASTRAKEVRG